MGESVLSDYNVNRNSVRSVVSKCLELKYQLLTESKRVADMLKYINMDLDDLRVGRLDRILDRQMKDSKAVEYSIFTISEKPGTEGSPVEWKKPYILKFRNPEITPNVVELTCSSAKDHAIGTYTVGPENEVVHLRG